MITAVIFDMDGLLLDSEVYWELSRREYAGSQGCDWTPQHELGVKGHNSMEWAAVIRSTCGLQTDLQDIMRGVAERMKALYDEHLPLLPGAVSTVRDLAERYPLAIASSSPPWIIDHAMTLADLRACFSVVVSSDEVGRGKPNPDVFLVAADRLGHPPAQIAVFEDSSSGIRAANRAGTHVIAVPNPHYPPEDSALELADLVLRSLTTFHSDMLLTVDR